MSLDELGVHIEAPASFMPRAIWVLDTLLAQCGCCVAVTTDAASADRACLAYAAAPVPGVPTIPCSAAAMELFAAGRSLPPGSFVQPAAAGGVAGAFVASAADGFAVPFDLVASAFVLLACWDERTTPDRDRHGRLPIGASVFAANPSLDITEPVVDRYVELLRAMLGPRLERLGRRSLREPGWMWPAPASEGAARDGAGGRGVFAVALMHDLDNLWRWTPRGFAAAGYRGARALRRRDWSTVVREAGDAGDWLTRHLPRGTDPYWTFPQILGGENARDAGSTFFVIARHTHRRDGNQPETYKKRLPAALEILARHDREVALHGNDADRDSLAALTGDRDRLELQSGAAVRGIRYHYLRCLYHETLPLLERAGIDYDSSLAFAEREGYRCGCSFPFHPYNLAEERPLRLVELPLAVMDGTLQQPHYRALPAGAAEEAALAVLDGARRSGGAVGILWHNNRFDPRVARGYDGVYWRLLDRMLAEGAWATSAGAIVARWRRAVDGSDPVAERPPRPESRMPTGCRPRDGGAPRVLHLSVVHKPDDPRIYERECRSLADAGYRVGYLAPGADAGCDASGVLMAPLPLRSRRTRFLDSADIVRTFRALCPDVVHVHDPELLTLFPALKAWGLRLVYDMHEYVPEAVASKPYIPAPLRPAAAGVTSIAQRTLATLADGVVVVTEEQLAALGRAPRRRLVLPNYPRLERFDDAEPLEDLAADPRLKLIYVGSLSRARGCTMMLDVMERLAAEEAVLYLGGTFNDAALETEVRGRLAGGLGDRVRLLGRVPPRDLPRHLAAADVVWVPSLPDQQYRHRTIPTKLLEGMALRRAVLVSDMTGRGELVRREACGLAVPPGADGHLQGVRRLLADRRALSEMGARGRAAVERSYSWEAVAGDLVDFYGSLCAGLPGRTVAPPSSEE